MGGSAVVQTKGHGHHPLHMLPIGAEVLVAFPNGTIGYDTAIFVSTDGQAAIEYEYVKLTTSMNKTIELSPQHMLHVLPNCGNTELTHELQCCTGASLASASRVKTGDCLFGIDKSHKAVTPETVASVSIVRRLHASNVYLQQEHGSGLTSIIINGLAASTVVSTMRLVDTYGPEAANELFDPLREVYAVSPQAFAADTLALLTANAAATANDLMKYQQRWANVTNATHRKDVRKSLPRPSQSYFDSAPHQMLGSLSDFVADCIEGAMANCSEAEVTDHVVANVNALTDKMTEAEREQTIQATNSLVNRSLGSRVAAAAQVNDNSASAALDAVLHPDNAVVSSTAQIGKLVGKITYDHINKLCNKVECMSSAEPSKDDYDAKDAVLHAVLAAAIIVGLAAGYAIYRWRKVIKQGATAVKAKTAAIEVGPIGTVSTTHRVQVL